MKKLYSKNLDQDTSEEMLTDVNDTCRLAMTFSHELIGFVPRQIRITEICLCNVDPLKPQFYIVKLVYRGGLQGYKLFFLISALKYRLWILVRTASSRRF